MIPIQLIIEGLYSYQKRQTIDFSNLTGAGLFGIFGATGSGKSSILEAVSYALYGETERMNAREGRNYNMMNLKSDRVYIEFDFRNHENRVFRASRELRRNSRRFEEVRPPRTTFYERIGDQWIPLDHVNAEKIIGLSYNNFKRTIIIPQGQFREFLELGPTARTDMMKEIFQLHRYDLQHSVRRLEGQNKSLLDQTEGQLKGYETVSEEGIEGQKKELEAQEKYFSEAEKEHQRRTARYEKLKLLKADYMTLQKKEVRLAEMEKEGQEMEKVEKQIDKYERISHVFRPLLEDLEKYRGKKESLHVQRDQAENMLKSAEQALAERMTEQKGLSTWYDNLTEKQTKENDLFYIARMIESAIEMKSLEKRVEKGQALVKDKEKNVESIRVQIRSSEKKIGTMKAGAVEAGLLVEVTKWFSDQKNLRKNQAERARQMKELQKKLFGTEAELKGKRTDEKGIQTYEASVEKDLMELERQKSELEVRQRLAAYAQQLEEGKPCFLCGSTEHPHVVVAEDVSGQLKEAGEKIQKLKDGLVSLQKERTEMMEILTRKQFYEEQMKAGQQELQWVEKQLEEHLSRFRWTGFDPGDPAGFEEKLSEARELNNQIREEESGLSRRRVQLETEQKKLDEYRRLLERIRLDMKQEQSGFDRDFSDLKILKFEDHKNESADNIRLRLKSLQKKNRAVKNRYEVLNKEILEFSQKKSVLETQKNVMVVQLNEVEKEMRDFQKRIAENLEKEEMYDVDAVRRILEKNLDVKKERERIHRFRVDFEVLKKEIGALREKLKSAAFDVAEFSKEEENWKSSEKRVKDINEKVVGLRGELHRLAKAYEEKQRLMEEWSRLSRRAENMKVMAGLFKAAGFVQYVSTIYLSQLCDHANVRFQRMTRNQLRLQLGTNNEFEIVDYLNEGRSRSVKTLSGGQSFQVSLSLALALAESVQANALAEKNFFFIDEGFGTQDSQSVNIIFETLVNLNKEDKIVGIISHVEELKERIPVSLTVVNDPEKGSLIRSS